MFVPPPPRPAESLADVHDSAFDQRRRAALRRERHHLRHLLPAPANRWCDRRRPRLALRRQERRPGADPRRSRDAWASPTRSGCSTAASPRASSSASEYNTGAIGRVLPRALPGLLLHHAEPRAARPAGPPARHAVARRRRRGPVALRRRGHRRRLGAQTWQSARPHRDGRRARGRLAADLLHWPAGPVDLQLRPRLDRAGRRPTPRSRRTPPSGPTTCSCRGSRCRSSTPPPTRD